MDQLANSKTKVERGDKCPKFLPDCRSLDRAIPFHLSECAVATTSDLVDCRYRFVTPKPFQCTDCKPYSIRRFGILTVFSKIVLQCILYREGLRMCAISHEQSLVHELSKFCLSLSKVRLLRRYFLPLTRLVPSNIISPPLDMPYKFRTRRFSSHRSSPHSNRGGDEVKMEVRHRKLSFTNNYMFKQENAF